MVYGGLAKNRAEASYVDREGFSVFLSLFDDSPKVKRVFCPKRSVTIRKRMRETVRQASAVVFPGDREGEGLRPQFSHRYESGSCQGDRRNDEARF